MPPLKLRTVLSVLFLGSALAVGFFAGRLTSRPLKTTSSPLEMATINGAELFDSQTATITGRVIKVTGEKLTIQDEQNQAADFPVISTVLISKPVNGRPVASQSGGLKNLELNEDALLLFDLSRRAECDTGRWSLKYRSRRQVGNCRDSIFTIFENQIYQGIFV